MASCSLHAADSLLAPSRLQRRRRSASRHASASSASASTTPSPLPQSAAAQVRQCAAAVTLALQAGVALQTVEVELPLIGATDLDDWPGGVRQQLQAARPLVLQLLSELAGASVRVAQSDIEASDGVVLFTTATHRAVTFVTADTLREVASLCEGDSSCTVLVNAEWKEADFGWGVFTNTSLKRFADSCVETFSVRKLRVRGQEMRCVRSYPSPWAVYALGLDGERDKQEVIGTFPRRPVYAEIEALLAALGPRSIANADISTRLRAELAFNQESMKDF